MQVHFERSGGFAGITLATDVDSDQLPASDSAKLADLVNQANFFNLPQKLKTGKQGADQFQYNITVVTPGKSHSIQLGDGNVPQDLRPLIDWLLNQARKPKS